MEKVCRILYSPAWFCTPNLLSNLVLRTIQEKDGKISA
jgi:hypothetical protein